MFKVNENFAKLPGSYLFANIAKRVSAFQAEHPEKEIIRLGIGDVTQPIGINLFVASSLTDVPVMQIAKKAMPLIVFFLIALLAITFIPQISLLLVS